jgi:hypothetical protein
MLYLVAHSHTLENCPAREGKEAVEKHYRSLQSDVAERLGVKVLALYTAPIEHSRFFILEAESVESLRDYLEPLYMRGKVEVFPIISFSERVHALEAEREPVPEDFYCMTCRQNFFESDRDAHKGHKYFSQKDMEEIWPHEFGGEAGSG